MSLNSISPIDGRYYNKTSKLQEYFSEKALIKYRIFTEINYLFELSKIKETGVRDFTSEEEFFLSRLFKVKDEDAQIVKDIETKGYNNIPATNHDVKAVEYFIKLRLNESTLSDITEMIHFALTSEDVNNISYSLMLKEGFNKIIFPEIINIYDKLYNLAGEYKNSPMLARTHGQTASPTTFGKEILIFASRIKEEIKNLINIPLLVKLNGATGNFNAHNVVFPQIDWQDFSEKLIKEIENQEKTDEYKYIKRKPLIFKHNKITTQIEPHDSISRIFDSVKRLNTILIDFCQDTWRYISDGWIKQKTVKGEIGSSAMPHKVNPIDFENAEGNLGIANALFSFFSSKLPISRLQRDLSDSTVQRNIGTAFAHCLIAYKSILKGLSKIQVNEELILNKLKNSPEVIAEAFQNILRTQNVEKPYELLKEITRGKDITVDDFYKLANELNINEETKKKLLNIKPENYIGIASKIVEEFDPVIY